MSFFRAFVSWPSAQLTEKLVRNALESLDIPPTIVDALPDDHASQDLLQWSTYDLLDHDLTYEAGSSPKVLSSSYVIRKALIRKHYLSRCIHNYVVKHPDSILHRAVPRTWDLELSFADELDEMWGDELWDLGSELEDGSDEKWWILKPGMADRGMGIRLFHTKQELERIFQDFEKDDEDEPEPEREEGTRDTGVVTSQLRHFVIQEYLSNPLLLDPSEVPLPGHGNPRVPQTDRPDLNGHKFHLRAYCVASGALTVYLYERILALFSALPYSMPGHDDDEIHLAAHLTNTSLQTERGEAGVRLFDELVGCKILSFTDGGQHGALVLSIIDVQDIKDQMSQILAETFKAALNMSVHFQTLPNAFELYGIDFLVTHSSNSDRRFQVQLLEVNSEPAIELTGPRLTWILQDLFQAIAQTCVEPFFKGSSQGGEWRVGEVRQHLKKCLDTEVRGFANTCPGPAFADFEALRSFTKATSICATMSSQSSSIVFDDIFTINGIDKEGKKFDRVSRLFAHSKNYDMDLTLDYNIELYPLNDGESFALALATSLHKGPPSGGANGVGEEEDKDRDVWRPDGKGVRGLEEEYDYVMYGKVYRFDGGTAEIVTAFASFGGLLMSLTGSFRHMANIVLGDPIYILLRK
ncbi:tubulin-tyrosine ligase family-domain-containing protein [Cristinia sonorae]|uniref:Tubulin-tyrosine ligase family-domain-containing protein n=1 Tax=Cristinia sonorae TaxID=1940300 RepID=A0A8K0UNJ2_9AGAR|nr:tubulin-tyrosine ligase family-domain-containing protein [Cristinia sonorae]